MFRVSQSGAGRCWLFSHNAVGGCRRLVGKTKSWSTTLHRVTKWLWRPPWCWNLPLEWSVSYTTIVGNKFHDGGPIALTKVGTKKKRCLSSSSMLDGYSSLERELLTLYPICVDLLWVRCIWLMSGSGHTTRRQRRIHWHKIWRPSSDTCRKSDKKYIMCISISRWLSHPN